MTDYVTREDVLRVLEDMAEMLESGAGELEPGGRMRQAIRRVANLPSAPVSEEREEAAMFLNGLAVDTRLSAEVRMQLNVIACLLRAPQQQPDSEEREECARDLDEIVSGYNVVGQEAAICARAARLLRAPQQQASPAAWLWTVKGESVPCAASLVEGNPDRHISTPVYLPLHPPRQQPVSEERPCTCHPDDNPPRPCPKKYALSECRAAAADSEERENAARWKAGESLAQFPEFCGHWEGRPGGQGWYHVATGERWYATAGEAMDAALKEKP